MQGNIMGEEKTCEFELSDGRPCGCPSWNNTTPLCIFHKHVDNERKWWGGGHEIFKTYANYFKGKEVEYAGLRYENLSFAGDIFGDDTSVNFDNSIFRQCSFIGCTFLNASFAGKSEFHDTIFKGCKFIGAECDFNKARFYSSNVIFENCQFILRPEKEGYTSKVSFDKCYVETEESLFANCYVKADRFLMSDLKLIGRTKWPMIHIAISNQGYRIDTPMLCLDGVKNIDLHMTYFQGGFVYYQLPVDEAFCPQVRLTGINFGQMSFAQIHHANLRKTLFLNSSIENLKFYDCRWRREEGYLRLYDDWLSSQKRNVKNYSELIRLYVQLKKNFESDRNYIGAGDWFYREMEARRNKALSQCSRIKKYVLRGFSVISLYKIASRYGESYIRPLVWLLLILFLFSIIYQFSGFSMSGEVIDYDVCWGCGFSWGFLIDFPKALLFSLLAMSLQIGKVAHLEGNWSIFWYVIHLLLTAILLPLFLLAIRRKFRR